LGQGSKIDLVPFAGDPASAVPFGLPQKSSLRSVRLPVQSPSHQSPLCFETPSVLKKTPGLLAEILRSVALVEATV
jgi:hypothetical protein